jgi:2,3,4,5-tetrahydropyridine-2-carboxylate N-succinyltransferase
MTADADADSPDPADATAVERAVTDLWRRHEAAAVAVGDPEAVAVLDAFLDALESGTVRAVEPVEESGDAGDTPPGRAGWRAAPWVKRGVLLNFALRPTTDHEHGGVTHRDVLPVRGRDGEALAAGVRNTPHGTVVRRGARVGEDAVLMSPAFVNVGASVGPETLVDSCVTVGSCARVGANVKIGANTLVGGVLEPVEETPVVVEDGVTLGAGCRVTSGFVVGRDAVVAENTLLTPRIPVYDLVDGEVYYGHLPPERRAVARYVPSSLTAAEGGDLLPESTLKPAVVATDLGADTVAAVEREEVLRS